MEEQDITNNAVTMEGDEDPLTSSMMEDEDPLANATEFKTMPTSKLLLAGGLIMPMIEKLLVTQSEIKAIGIRLMYVVHPGDLIVLGLVAIFAVPFCTLVFGKKRSTVKFDDHYSFQIGSLISQAAILAILVYVFDIIVVVLTTMGFDFVTLNQMSKGFAKILYISWIAQRFCVVKRYLLGRAFDIEHDKLGRVWMINRLLDSLIIGIASFILLEILDVDMGIGVKSIFAFGSAGTLVVGLASKDMANMFVNGLLLTTSNRISEKDHIKLGTSGLCGQVMKIGWFQTTLQHYNNLSEVIPNSELGMQRVANLSRVERCQIKQDIRISFDDYDKIENLLQTIKDEIKESCPKLIIDGSKPYRAFVCAIREDHIRAQINVHFEDIKPFGEEFNSNQHTCIMAILRAAKKCDVKFVSGLYPNSINN